MKNIHILPTDKPSRLHLGNSGLVLCDLNFDRNTINSQHIYITSDEEIKEGDWYLYCNQINKRIRKNPKAEYPYPNYQKIILTTDQDLIKDGIQAIDDEFLEWFVMNPSYEKVKIDKSNLLNTSRTYLGVDKYKIIIPKEEPCSFCKGTGQTVSSTTISGFTTCDCINIPQEEPKQEPCDNCNNDVCCCIIRKQETLEEPKKLTVEEALLLVRNAPMTFVPNKRMYSEEDLLSAFKAGMMFIGEDKGSFKEWFEQF